MAIHLFNCVSKGRSFSHEQSVKITVAGIHATLHKLLIRASQDPFLIVIGGWCPD